MTVPLAFNSAYASIKRNKPSKSKPSVGSCPVLAILLPSSGKSPALDAVTDLGHATPDEACAWVKERSSAVNISTIYRTLELLEELGLVKHAHLSDRAPTYHSVGGHEHFHLVCRNCHRVISVDPVVLGSVLERLRADNGFTADIGHLTVFGRCDQCEETS